MKEKLDPKKFIHAMNEVCMEAKQATINLLKSNGKKCFVVNRDEYAEAEDQFYHLLEFCAVGIDEEDNLMIGGTETYYNGEDFDRDDYSSDFDPDFQPLEDVINEFSYPVIYEFVANNIEDNAVTLEKAKSLLS